MDSFLLIYLILTRIYSMKPVTLDLHKEFRGSESLEDNSTIYEAPAGSIIKKVIYNDIEVYRADEKDTAKKRIVTHEYVPSGVFLHIKSIYDHSARVTFCHATDSFVSKHLVKQTNKPTNIDVSNSFMTNSVNKTESEDSALSYSSGSECSSRNGRRNSGTSFGMLRGFSSFEEQKDDSALKYTDTNEMMKQDIDASDMLRMRQSTSYCTNIESILTRDYNCPGETDDLIKCHVHSEDPPMLNEGDTRYEDTRSILDHVIALNEMNNIEYDIPEYVTNQTSLEEPPFTIEYACECNGRLGSHRRCYFGMGSCVEADDGYFENLSLHSDPETYLGSIGANVYSKAQDMQFTSSIDMSNVVSMLDVGPGMEPKNADLETVRNAVEGNSQTIVNSSPLSSCADSESNVESEHKSSKCSSPLVDKDFESDSSFIGNTYSERTESLLEDDNPSLARRNIPDSKSDTGCYRSYEDNLCYQEDEDYTSKYKLRGYRRSCSLPGI